MDNIKDLAQSAKALYIWGPFAVLAVLMALNFWLVKRISGKEGKENRFLKVFAWANFLLMVGMIGTTTVIWIKLNLGRENLVSGRVGHLPANAELYCRADKVRLYWMKDYNTLRQGQVQMIDQLWQLVSDQPLDGSQVISIQLSQSTGRGDLTLEFQWPAAMLVGPNRNLWIEYKASTREMVVFEGGKIIQSIPGKSTELIDQAANDTAPSFQLASFTPGDPSLANGLRSNDPYIRRAARKRLIDQGPQAIPFINEVLEDPDGDYRLEVGALLALSRFDDSHLQSLSRTAMMKIQALQSSEDPATADLAKSVAKRLRLNSRVTKKGSHV